MPTPGVTLAPPTPAGMEEMPPEPARAPDDDEVTTATAPRACGRSPIRPTADAAVANIRDARPADRRARHRQQPVLASATRSPVRSPDSTSTSPARSPATSSAPRHRWSTGSCRRPTASPALQNNQVDVVVKTMTDHLRAQEAGQLLHGVPQRQPADPGRARFDDLAAVGSVRQAGVRREGHDVAASASSRSPRRRSSSAW